MSLRPIPNISNKHDVDGWNNKIHQILNPGVNSHTETINGKTFTWTNGVLTNVK
jgi:hypothetical protein